MPRFNYGGQALIEGVLMRGRDSIAVALRHPDGQIVWATERLDTGFHGSRWSKMPFVRGLVVLYETLVVGTRWLVRSASVAASEEGVELGRGAVALMLGITLVVGIGFFFLLPLLLASATAGNAGNGLVQQFLEGLIRVALFVVYLLLIARTPDVRRVFQYHGAEHMTIHALEHDDPLEASAVRRYPTAHPRCGTEFLVLVIIISILAFSLVGRQTPVIMVGSRILLIPVIAAVAYEVLRFAARHRDIAPVRWLSLPGIWVQGITTRQPTDDMIEVAIVSMEQAILADGEPLPAGSGTLEREPLEEAEARTRARFLAADDPSAKPRDLAKAAAEASDPAAQARADADDARTTADGEPGPAPVEAVGAVEAVEAGVDPRGPVTRSRP